VTEISTTPLFLEAKLHQVHTHTHTHTHTQNPRNVFTINISCANIDFLFL